jgi:hypothetical protein
MTGPVDPNHKFPRLLEALKYQIKTTAEIDSHQVQLSISSDRSKWVQEHQSEIQQVRDVHNNIANPQAKSGGYAMVVTADLINRTRRRFGTIATARMVTMAGIGLSGGT